MPLIPFPNVPKVSGVPAIPRIAGAIETVQAALSIAQGIAWGVFSLDSGWGIFDSEGNRLGDPSIIKGIAGSILDGLGIGSTLSTGSVEYSKETRISDFPIERGGFASFNKVEMPGAPIVTLLLSGTKEKRATFLAEIDSACKSTQLYTVATPEVTYVNYSLESYNYQRRAERGATLMIVEIRLKEIREVSASYAQKSLISAPQDPGADLQKDTGKVQATTPNTSTLKSIANKISGLYDSAIAYIKGK